MLKVPTFLFLAGTIFFTDLECPTVTMDGRNFSDEWLRATVDT